MKITDHQNTKIVATVGPACSSPEMLKKLIKAGVDVFRLNFSHGTHEQHKEVIDRIVEIREKYNIHVSILADLQGPKIRIGKIENDGFPIKKGDEILFVNENVLGNSERVSISYKTFPIDANPGERILLDDGNVIMEVVESNRVDSVKMKVLYGSRLSSNKGVNLPETSVSIPCLTEKDLIDLDYICTQDAVDWIALSFVRKAADVKQLRGIIDKKGFSAKLISKIEKPEAIENIDKIIKASDAIMIARGDLGIEVAMEKLPALQKMIINKCIKKGKPVITATQMMDSMIKNPNPTRAEILDVANAVLDGTDAVMLSGETSVGAHPALVVEAMNKIITEAEKNYEWTGKRPKPNPESETFFSDTICLNAAKVAEDLGASGIVGLTISGYTAFKISSYRPASKIFIFSAKEKILNTLNLVWGVKTFYYDKFTTTDETIEDLSNILKENRTVKKGDVLVNTGTMPLREKGRTNMLKVTHV
ncbi:pyruvate kinase [Portibacter lacus]|uniref:Pyruvate kinase n=1 Tax=Portibacter lacus TaxID=1099794 RepID=A0AA37SQP7_9BACT|nr:pyruvate kinase [Portibacter lacus]GLR17784.1 pyruvate kinase [Portibacter lacus]